jgi:hypothetical protein
MFEGVRAALAGVKPGKLVYMAIFDHRFVGKPTRPPLATLTWKDWKDQGQGPEIRRQGEPRTSFQPPPMAVSDSFIPAAVPQPAARLSAPPPAPAPSAPPAPLASAPSLHAAQPMPSSAVAIPPAPISVHPQPVAVTPVPAPVPSAPPPAAVVPDTGVMGIAPPAVGAPPAADASVAAPLPAVAPVAVVPVVEAPPVPAPIAPASASAPVAVAPIASVPAAPPAVALSAPPAPGPAAPAVPSAPPIVLGAPAAEAPVATSPAADVPIAASPIAPVVVADAVVVAPPAPQLVVVPEPAPAIPLVVPVAPSRPPAPSAPAVRQSGVDLIADLFECMHDLHFLPDALAGADFVLALMLDKLPSAAALVHFYDIDSREFVVVRAYGAGATKAMQVRTNEKDPLIAEAMRKRRAVVLDDGDTRAQNGRWALVGDPPRSLICAPVEQGGRFLGLLELSNPIDGQPFREGDGHAVTYIGEQFAEFLAERGVILDPERIGD